MGMTFDAILKDMARESPDGFLATFGQPTLRPVKPMNVDLAMVTAAADLVLGVGESLEGIVHLDFQSSASATKHADLLAYNALLYAHHRVPVHTAIILLRPEAAHSNTSGVLTYTARPGRSSMDFRYEVIRLWERPAESLLTGDVGVVPLAMLGRLPAGASLKDGLAAVAQRVVERLTKEVMSERARRLLTDALLPTGLRVRRDVARTIFQGVHLMEESDTYLMILHEGQEKARREAILEVGEERLGPCDEAVRSALASIADLDRLKRMTRRAAKASTWQEIIDTP